jgi:hypothetical protein
LGRKIEGGTIRQKREVSFFDVVEAGDPTAVIVNGTFVHLNNFGVGLDVRVYILKKK